MDHEYPDNLVEAPLFRLAWKPQACAWCGIKLVHPRGRGRPRLCCDADCTREHRNAARRAAHALRQGRCR